MNGEDPIVLKDVLVSFSVIVVFVLMISCGERDRDLKPLLVRAEKAFQEKDFLTADMLYQWAVYRGANDSTTVARARVAKRLSEVNFASWLHIWQSPNRYSSLDKEGRNVVIPTIHGTAEYSYLRLGSWGGLIKNVAVILAQDTTSLFIAVKPQPGPFRRKDEVKIVEWPKRNKPELILSDTGVNDWTDVLWPLIEKDIQNWKPDTIRESRSDVRGPQPIILPFLSSRFVPVHPSSKQFRFDRMHIEFNSIISAGYDGPAGLDLVRVRKDSSDLCLEIATRFFVREHIILGVSNSEILMTDLIQIGVGRHGNTIFAYDYRADTVRYLPVEGWFHYAQVSPSGTYLAVLGYDLKMYNLRTRVRSRTQTSMKFDWPDESMPFYDIYSEKKLPGYLQIRWDEQINTIFVTLGNTTQSTSFF